MYRICRESSDIFQPTNRPVRLRLFHIQAFHEPAVLLRRQQSGFLFTARPLEAAGLQALVQQQKSIALPVQRFDSVPASATEQKQRVGERIQLELLLNDAGQTIDSSSEIGVAAGNIDLVGSGKIIQHDCRIRSSMAVVSASAPE